MVNGRIGEELSQLARLLFDAAASKWYWAIGLEVLAGVIATVLNVSDFSENSALVGAAAVTILLILAYGLRLRFEVQYDTAETMRRQSVLTEALDWPVDRVQVSEWRQQVGKRIRSRSRTQPRSSDYYATGKTFGPQRLAEMTAESAFYTRHLYGKLKFWVWAAFLGALLLSAVAIIVALTRTVPTAIDLLIGRAVFSLVPIILSVNLLGWALRLERLVSGIRRVEEGLARSLGTTPISSEQVLRLVSEYNCQVIQGIPILDWLYKRWQHDIEELWIESNDTTLT